jgi:hypothetical protein
VNGFLAFLQQVGAWLAGQLGQAFGVLPAVLANKPEPARNVLVSLAVLAALAWIVPKIVKKLG